MNATGRRAALFGSSAAGLAACGALLTWGPLGAAGGLPWALALLMAWPVALAASRLEPAQGSTEKAAAAPGAASAQAAGPRPLLPAREVVGPALGGGALAASALVVAVPPRLLHGHPQPALDPLQQVGLALAGGQVVVPFLLLAALATFAVLPLLLVRRTARELEWQAGAGAFGAALLALPLALGAGSGARFVLQPLAWLAITGACLGALACLSDRRPRRRADAPPLAASSPAPPRALALLALALLVLATSLPFAAGPLLVRAAPVNAASLAAEAALREAYAEQQLHFSEHGWYAPTLGDLAARIRDRHPEREPPAWADSVVAGHALRLATTSRSEDWVAAADPQAPDAGRNFLHMDSEGRVTRSARGPFPLQFAERSGATTPRGRR